MTLAAETPNHDVVAASLDSNHRTDEIDRILIDLARTPLDQLERYMGRVGARSFLAHRGAFRTPSRESATRRFSER